MNHKIYFPVIGRETSYRDMALSVLGTQLFAQDSNTDVLIASGVVVPSGTKSAILVITIFDTTAADGVISTGYPTYRDPIPDTHIFSKSKEYYDSVCDGHVSIWYLNKATLDNDPDALFTFYTDGTCTDIMAGLIFLDSEIAEDAVAIEATGSDPSSPSITWSTVATDTIAVANSLSDQPVGTQLTLDAGNSLYIEDLGSDTALAAYIIRTSDGSQTISWTDADEDEDWVAIGVSYADAGGAATITGEAVITGAGALTATGLQLLYAKSYLSGLGALYSSAFLNQFASASLSGAGDLFANGLGLSYGNSVLSGLGLLTASGDKVVISSNAVFTGIGQLTASAYSQIFASAILSGSGQLTAEGFITALAKAILTGNGDLFADAFLTNYGVAHLSGLGNLFALGINTSSSSAILTGLGNLTASGELSILASAILTGNGQLTASILQTALAKAVLSGTGQLTASGNNFIYAVAPLSGTGILVATGEVIGEVIIYGEAVLTGLGQLTAQAHLIVLPENIVLTGAGDLFAQGYQTSYAQSHLSGLGILVATGEVVSIGTVYGEAVITGLGDLSSSGWLTSFASANLSGIGDLVADGYLVIPASSVLIGNGVLTASGEVTGAAIIYGEAVLSGIGALLASGKGTTFAQANLSGVGFLSAEAFSSIFGDAVLSGNGILIADGSVVIPVVLVSGDATLVDFLTQNAISLDELIENASIGDDGIMDAVNIDYVDG